MTTRLQKLSRAIKRVGTSEGLLFELANLRDDGLRRFRGRWSKWYGHYSEGELLRRRDELRMLWRYCASGGQVVEVQEKTTMNLWERWEDATRGTGLPLGKFICDYWLREGHGGLYFRWTAKEKRLVADPKCLPAMLACAAVLHADHLRFCENSDCPARYFIASRRDQKYCSQDCAWPAKQEAKRKWWQEHRSKKARRQKPGEKRGRR